MGVPKIKNMVITALILINVFFLIFIVYDRTDDAQRERQALEDACAVLARAGIELDPDDVYAVPVLRAMRTVRDLAAQRAIAETLLGEVTETEQGGILYQYVNERTGSAAWRSGGEFTISINEDVYTASANVTSVARGLMHDMGLEPAGFETDESGGGQTVTALCAYRGARIFNCSVTFRFAGGSLRAVDGKYASGVTEVDASEAAASPATALLTFLSAVKKGEIACTQIKQATGGYFARDATTFGDGALVPAWLIEADSGRYIVDTETGEIMLVAE